MKTHPYHQTFSKALHFPINHFPPHLLISPHFSMSPEGNYQCHQPINPLTSPLLLLRLTQWYTPSVFKTLNFGLGYVTTTLLSFCVLLLSVFPVNHHHKWHLQHVYIHHLVQDPNNSLRHVAILCYPFHKWRNWDMKKLQPKVHRHSNWQNKACGLGSKILPIM